MIKANNSDTLATVVCSNVYTCKARSQSYLSTIRRMAWKGHFSNDL